MIDRLRSLAKRTGWAAVLGASSLALVAVSPAAADGDCPVDQIGIVASNSTLMAQTDGTWFQGEIEIQVFCKKKSTLIPNSTIQIMSDTTKSGGDEVLNDEGKWIPLEDPAAAIISVPTGQRLISIRTTDPNFKVGDWRVKVGTHTVKVASANGVPMDIDDMAWAGGNVWAQTPELGSLALFGTGAAGMAGYALTRLRARRGRRD